MVVSSSKILPMELYSFLKFPERVSSRIIFSLNSPKTNLSMKYYQNSLMELDEKLRIL